MNITIALILAATALRPGGDMRDVSMRPMRSSGTLTIDAMPYTRTVTCGSYTLTGSASGAGAVSWSASPSGASGSCTGTTSWSCVVSVAPDATGEGVEAITVSQAGGGSDTETIGFYVNGSHSCFLSQSVDGNYNNTLANLDAVATWENLGSSALDVTQGTGAAQPTFRTSIVGGQPVVRCDGGDSLAATTAADWNFLSDATDATVGFLGLRASDDGTWQMYATTRAFSGSNAYYLASDNRTTSSGLLRSQAAGITASTANNTEGAGVFNMTTTIYDDTGGVDLTVYLNNTSVATASTGTGVPAVGPLFLCAGTDGANRMTGDIFAVRIYQSALSSTQRGINKAVDEWALGGTLPVTP